MNVMNVEPNAEREEAEEEEPERRGGRHTCGNPVVSCNDAPEGDPSANKQHHRWRYKSRYKCSKREWI